jgi:hypothetical protein
MSWSEIHLFLNCCEIKLNSSLILRQHICFHILKQDIITSNKKTHSGRWKKMHSVLEPKLWKDLDPKYAKQGFNIIQWSEIEFH